MNVFNFMLTFILDFYFHRTFIYPCSKVDFAKETMCNKWKTAFPFSLQMNHFNSSQSLLVSKITNLQCKNTCLWADRCERSRCMFWFCGPNPCPQVFCCLMTVVRLFAAALPHPACLSECLKCASQMFGAHTCSRRRL